MFVNFVAKKWIAREDVKNGPGPVREMEVDSVDGFLLS
jgi:hypothetical protein